MLHPAHMHTFHRHLLALAVALTACSPMDLPDDSSGEAADELGDDTTDTTSATSDLPGETDGCNTTEDTTGDTTETGEPIDWFVIDNKDVVVGKLATPDAELWPLPTDMFGGGGPPVAYLTTSTDGITWWGFTFNGHVGGLDIPTVDPFPVEYTGPDCTGTPVGRFATVIQTGNSPAQIDCGEAQLDAMGDDVIWHYGHHADAQAWVALRWLDATGVFGKMGGGDRWFGVPVDQEWPAWKFTFSHMNKFGVCENVNSSGCMIELVDIGIPTDTEYMEPFSLVPG